MDCRHPAGRRRAPAIDCLAHCMDWLRRAHGKNASAPKGRCRHLKTDGDLRQLAARACGIERSGRERNGASRLSDARCDCTRSVRRRREERTPHPTPLSAWQCRSDSRCPGHRAPAGAPALDRKARRTPSRRPTPAGGPAGGDGRTIGRSGQQGRAGQALRRRAAAIATMPCLNSLGRRAPKRLPF